MNMNPDPRKYVLKRRKGKTVLVDKQIVRWQKRKKRAARKMALDAARIEEANKPTPTPAHKRNFFL